jgi:hypothetical protein
LFNADNGTYYTTLIYDTAGYQQFRFLSTDPNPVINAYAARTTETIRDPSAHYHVVLAVDTTQAVATDRVRIFVNGVQSTLIAELSGFPSLNYDTYINSTVLHETGGFRGTDYLDGYLSEINFIDGQALDASSFGQFDTNGVWIPKAYGGTYGTNGFYLKFNNGSTAANLGLDSSGNGNTWTVTNVSVTAGPTYDWMTDTPTDNYAVLNSLLNQTQYNLQAPKGTAGTITNANLTVTGQANNWNGWTGTFPVSSGKWYWEVLSVAEPISGYKQLGIVSQAGTTVHVVASGLSVPGDIHGFALNLDAGTFVWYKNGVLQATLATGLTGLWLPYVVVANSAQMTFNFGQRPFAYTPPTGFVALRTSNLPSALITNGKNHFDVKTYTGTAATQNITGLAFQPDLVWMKSRGRALDHALYDRVRGVQLQLESNNTGAETTETTGLTAFNSNGWTMGALDQINGTTATNSYVGWAWRANGAAVTNTAGSISSQVSANTAAGISIVTWTGSGSPPQTIGHGLGAVPKLIITKSRVAIPTNWIVYHGSISNTLFLLLNTTEVNQTSANAWNNTTPTSTVFTVGSSSLASANPYVAYCFAEVPGFSAIGRYGGNGVADGPFVYCGFRPRYVLIKSLNVDATNWVVKDSARSPNNAALANLFANSNLAEDTLASLAIDLLSNGFKIRGANSQTTTSGTTYVYIAFAENPFGGSNVNPVNAR